MTFFATVFMLVVGLCACGTPKPASQTAVATDKTSAIEPTDGQEEDVPNGEGEEAEATEQGAATAEPTMGPELLELHSGASVTVEKVIVLTAGVSVEAATAAGEGTVHHHRLCYDQVLQQTPTASGAVRVKVVINMAEERTQVSILSADFGGDLLTGCVQSGFYGLPILPHNDQENVEIEYHLGFTP